MSRRRTRSLQIKDEFEDDPAWLPAPDADKSESENDTSDDSEVVEISLSSSEANVDNSVATGMDSLRAVEEDHLCQDVDDYINESKSKNTKKLDDYVQRVFADTMKAVTTNQNLPEVPPLIETPTEDLPHSLERFFMVAVKKDGDMYNASTYDQFYQTIARVLIQRKGDPIDIKSDVRFKRLERVVKSRREAAVKAGKVPGMNSAQSVSPDLIREAFRQKKFGRDSPRALIRSVNYIMMTGWGTRPAEEARATNNEHLVMSDYDTDGYPFQIERFETLTKTRRGDEGRELTGTIYKDDQHPDICPVRTICEYMARKTPAQREPKEPFMLNVNNAAEKDPEAYKFWYTGVMGKNTISKLFRSVFEELGVDCKKLKISANSGRKQLLQAGADAMVPGNFLSKLAGHKVESSQLNYMRVKEDSHKAAALAINRRISGKTEGTDFGTIFKAEQKRRIKPAETATSGALENIDDEEQETEETEERQQTSPDIPRQPTSSYSTVQNTSQAMVVPIMPQQGFMHAPPMAVHPMVNHPQMMAAQYPAPSPCGPSVMMSPPMMNQFSMPVMGHTMNPFAPMMGQPMNPTPPMMLGHMNVAQPMMTSYGPMNLAAGSNCSSATMYVAQDQRHQRAVLQDVTNKRMNTDGQGGAVGPKFKFKKS